MPQSPLRTLVLTLITLVAFAANSVLARLALGTEAIDAAGYTSVRLVAGAVVLWLITRVVHRADGPRVDGTWRSAAALFLYAIALSYAYLSLDTGIGALILFGAVQATMIGAGLMAGERPGLRQWLGLVIALGGLVYLVSPGLTAPDPLGTALMALSGVAWGVYSLYGRGAADPVGMTAGNFLRTVPLTLAVSLLALPWLHLTRDGLFYAVLSGAVASGMGYVVWYAALRGLTATRAATVQLTVPVLASIGGVVFMAEPVTLRLLLAGGAILGGVALAVLSRH